MVARSRRGARRVGRVAERSLTAALDAWRRGLTHVAQLTTEAAEVGVDGFEAAYAGVCDVVRGTASTRWTIGTGVAAALAGAFARFGVVALREGAVSGVVAGGVLLAWCVARLIAMIVIAEHSQRVGRAPAIAAWAAGTLPYALAANWWLHALAWCTGLVLSARAARGTRLSPAQTRAIVWPAFGLEAAGAAVRFLFANLLLGLGLLGG